MELTKKGYWRWPVGVAASLLATAIPLTAPFSSAAPPKESRPSTPVILISVDTLRADSLSCYGNRRLRTPHIDAMAEGGTVFSQISSQVPLTIPSHTSLLTSIYPFVSGIEENGEQVRPGAVTLATVLRSRGYGTAAFVGGFVLDRRFGLDQGFDLYDSPFNVHLQPGEDQLDLKRLGEDVARSASGWLDGNSDRPFFLFLHLYDLHMPYTLPAAWRTRARGSSYMAALAYVDDVLGHFWQHLDSTGLLAKALVVFTSDHGESLGEHGERTHGYFIYQSTLHVPLIIHWPAVGRRYPAKTDQPASLLDVAPTILAFLGLSQPGQFQGRSALEFLDRENVEPPREVYGESLYARDHLGCSALRSLREGRYKYIESPKPELYDLARDPVELHNLYARRQALALKLRNHLLSVESRFHPQAQSNSVPISPDVLASLTSLNYLAGATSPAGSPDSGPDPKDRLVEYQRYGQAIMLASEGRYSESAAVFHRILAEDPRNVLAHFYLAVDYFKRDQLAPAIEELRATLSLAPKYVRAEELLGTIWLIKKNYGQARVQFTHLLTIAPGDYGANYNLGVLDSLDGNLDAAMRHLRVALQADPQSAAAHATLGELCLQRGDLDRARTEFTEAIRLRPTSASAHYSLGLVFRAQKQDREADQEFRRALAADPGYRAARDALDHPGLGPK